MLEEMDGGPTTHERNPPSAWGWAVKEWVPSAWRARPVTGGLRRRWTHGSPSSSRLSSVGPSAATAGAAGWTCVHRNPSTRLGRKPPVGWELLGTPSHRVSLRKTSQVWGRPDWLTQPAALQRGWGRGPGRRLWETRGLVDLPMRGLQRGSGSPAHHHACRKEKMLRYGHGRPLENAPASWVRPRRPEAS